MRCAAEACGAPGVEVFLVAKWPLNGGEKSGRAGGKCGGESRRKLTVGPGVQSAGQRVWRQVTAVRRGPGTHPRAGLERRYGCRKIGAGR